MTKIRWIFLALVLAGLAACSSDEDDGISGETSQEETTTTVASTSTEGAGQDSTAPFDEDASPLTKRSGPVDPGTFRVDTIGTPFSFTTSEPMFVQLNDGAFFVLTDPQSNGPDDRDIVVTRVATLADPTVELNSVFEELGSGWAADDFSGWLDNATDQIVVSDRQDTTLGGLDATFAELKLGETDCTLDSPCQFIANHQISGKELVSDSTYRVWIVDQGDEDPLAVIVGINRETDTEWFDTADDVLASLTFGSVGPNPVYEATGLVELDVLGGVRTELTESAVMVQEPGGFGHVRLRRKPVGTYFLIGPNDLDGNALETTADLLATLEAGNILVEEVESSEVDGFEARVFTIGTPRSEPILTSTADTESHWASPPRGQMWVVEHPDRGLLVITAEAFIQPDEFFPMSLAQTEPIVESLEFIELG